jgi:hypothetical protein
MGVTFRLHAAAMALSFSCVCPSVAEETVTSSGTGFFINSAGWVVTNAHVVEGCANVKVASYGAAQTHVDAQNDLAVIRVIEPLANISVLPIRRAPPRLGEDIAALGYPLSNILSDSIKITTGNINSLVGVGNDTRYLQISAPIQPGNSGGPMVDRAGSVLGINTATLGSRVFAETGVVPQNVNFAVRASVLEMFLQARGVEYQVVEQAGAPLPTADLAEKVAPSVLQILCLQGNEARVANAAPDPSPIPSPSLPSAEMKAAAFIAKYHEAWSSENGSALAYMSRAYGPSVTFYGKVLGKSELMEEKRKFADRWPIRRYTVDPASVSINCSGVVCHIEAIVDWSASSPSRNKSAKGAATFALDWDSASETILSETGKVIKADRSNDPMALVSRWHEENGTCRGSSDASLYEKACELREVISNQLYASGWCYGKRGEFGYQMAWHVCTADSIR